MAPCDRSVPLSHPHARKAIYPGNKVHRDWLLSIRDRIQATLSERNRHGSHDQTQGDKNDPPYSRLSLENVAEHDNNMGNDTRKIHHMPGATIERKWLNYIHRGPFNAYERSSYGSRSSYDSILSYVEESSSNM